MDRDRSESVRAALQDAVGARYEVLNLHGQGGMGMVFCARARALGKLVAIKVLVPGVALSGLARDRFRREARLAASLSHPSIVPVFEFDDSGEFPYIIMDFVRGESLGRRLRHEGRLLPDATRRILADLADALDHAHRRRIIHRDIKPENVLIAADSGRPLLADFGIAKALNDATVLTHSAVVLGTPEYMSPEQAAGERDVDYRSDLYSLGALGYTMLAGRAPHQGNGTTSLITKILTEEPVPLRELAPNAPQDLVAAISRCLEKNPERRWPDAHALQQALAGAPREDEPIAEELRAVTGFGAFVMVVLFAAMAWALHGWWLGDHVVTAIALLGGGLVSAGFLIYARGIAAHGSSMRDVLRVSMWPPKWWGLWWPRGLRRPTDVWECLPTSARLARVLLTLMFAAILVWLIVRSMIPEVMRDPVRWSVVGLAVLALLVVAAGLLRWNLIGLAVQDASRLLFGPTVGTTFWGQPNVSAVLITRPDAGAACATPLPDRVRALLHAIEDAAGRLSGKAREIGSDATEAARLLADDVERLDAEIEDLARDAENLEQLEQQLTKLRETRRDTHHLEAYVKAIREQADVLDMKRLERHDAHVMLRAMYATLGGLAEQSAGGTLREAERVERLRSLVAAARNRPRPEREGPS